MSDRSNDPNTGTPAGLLRRVDRVRWLALQVLRFERLWPALWPALGAAGVFLCVALIGLPAMLPPLPHVLLLVAAFAIVGLLLRRALRGFASPDDNDAHRRVEVDSALRHRPLSALLDRPVPTDAAGQVLWQAHVARTVARVGRLRVGWPHPGLAAIDRHALRGALVVAIVAAIGIAGSDAPARLADAFRISLPKAPPPPEAELQAWVTPPAYTGLPPLFLKPAGGPVSVPDGSRLTASVTGGPQGAAVPDLLLGHDVTPFHPLDAGSFQAEQPLAQSGRLVVRRGGHEMAGWDLTVIADQPPTASFPDAPGPAAEEAGRTPRLRLPWQTADDYGVVSLSAELRLRERPAAAPLVIPIALPGASPKNARGVLVQDLTAHPWAGLDVTAKLVARDARGQLGPSEEAGFTLPEREFQHPVARELMALRKLLSLEPEQNRPQVAARLTELADAPTAFAGDSGIFLALSATASLLRLDGPLADAAVDDVQGRLWQMALKLEEGAAERTARQLEAAREAAKDALEKAAQAPTADNKTEFDKKIAELEEAIRNHMQALTDELRREQGDRPTDPDAPKLDSKEMEKLAEQARQLAREGKMQDAEKRMAELEKMLAQLKSAKQAQNAQEQRNQEQRQKGQKQMGALQDMVQREGGLMDHAQSRDPTQNGSADPNAPQAGQANPGGGGSGAEEAQRAADRKVQQALRRALGELAQQVGDLTGDVPKSLGEADGAMRDAAQAMADGDDAAAEVNGQKAIDALQKGGKDMQQAMSKQFGSPQAGEAGEQGKMDATADGEEGDDQQQLTGRGTRRPGSKGLSSHEHGQSSRRDPLGRRLKEGTSGADESADAMVPEQMEEQRTRAIQDELRRRGSERDRPQQELDYIDRLLKQF